MLDVAKKLPISHEGEVHSRSARNVFPRLTEWPPDYVNLGSSDDLAGFALSCV